MRRHLLALTITAGLCLSLAACTSGPSSDSMPSAESGASGQSGAAPAEPIVTAEAALETALASAPSAPPGQKWDGGAADLSGFDPGAAVSWITVPVAGAGVSSARMVALFHEGTYVGTAGGDWQRFTPWVDRSDGGISITYSFQIGAEPVNGATGRATATFRWDESRNAIIQTGETGSDAYERVNGRPQEGLAGGIENAYPGGGGPLPEGAQAVTSSEHDGVTVWRSPTGRLKCGFLSSGWSSCGIPNWRAEELYEVEGISPTGKVWANTLRFSDTGQASPGATGGDVPTFMLVSDNDARVLNDGEIVYAGDYTCADTEHGWTCWNLITGHGAYFNVNGYEAF